MRSSTPARMIFGARLFCALAVFSAAAPALAGGPNELRISELNDEHVQIAAGQGEAAWRCVATGGPASAKEAVHAYALKLNSEAGTEAVYLKAARMGGGIYVHLPYLVTDGCKGINFHVAFYENVLDADPMRGVGVVAAMARNKGNYTGFGGDSLNIIRMSYDNPTPANVATLDQVFPATFAHELAHKLQSERLFEQPLARHIVEGSADFIKIVVLQNAGVIDEAQAKERVRKAAADCAKFADARTLRTKAGARTLNFREPYDCGMVYYFVSYYSSGMQGQQFVDALRQSLAGDGKDDALCLMFEPACRNEKLNGVAGDRDAYLRQAAWLDSQLATRPLPVLARRK